MFSSTDIRHCPRCDRQTGHLREGINHGIHAVLTVWTSGFWIPVWITWAWAVSKQNPFLCMGCGRAARSDGSGVDEPAIGITVYGSDGAQELHGRRLSVAPDGSWHVHVEPSCTIGTSSSNSLNIAATGHTLDAVREGPVECTVRPRGSRRPQEQARAILTSLGAYGWAAPEASDSVRA